MTHELQVTFMEIAGQLILSIKPESSSSEPDLNPSLRSTLLESSDAIDPIDLLKFFSKILVCLERFKDRHDKVIELTSGMDNNFINLIEALRSGGYPESDLTYSIVKRIVSVIMCTIDHYIKYKQFDDFRTVEERYHIGHVMMIIASGYFGWDIESLESMPTVCFGI